jgi:hypothetical protein
MDDSGILRQPRSTFGEEFDEKWKRFVGNVDVVDAKQKVLSANNARKKSMVNNVFYGVICPVGCLFIICIVNWWRPFALLVNARLLYILVEGLQYSF